MSYERMKKREAELKAEVARMLAAAEAADAQEDETFGQRQARRRDAGLGWRQAEAAGEDPAGNGTRGGRRQAGAEGRASIGGRKGTAAPAKAARSRANGGGAIGQLIQSQRNFTDPKAAYESKDGFVQAYNAQAAVDAGPRSLSRTKLTQCGSDQGQLVP